MRMRRFQHCLWTILFACAGSLNAQDQTLLFSATAPGISKAITNWGLDVTWASYDNIRRGLMFMGTNEVDMVRVAFLANAPVTNGVNGNDLSPAQKAELSNMASLANMAGAGKPWTFSSGTGAGVDPWFKSGGDVIPSRWVQAMEAAKKHYNHALLSTEPFNEPDYGWGQGTIQNLYDILGLLQVNTNFAGVALSGGSTLNCDQANTWYDQLKTRTTEGTTHTLAGSFNSYVNFLQNVVASGDVPVNPEAHNVMEVIAGAEYGLRTAIWWGTAELARGEFVKANQGQRLGYAEDRGKWTAAAVYRAPSGAVQAFVGASERMATTTAYRFFSRDRDVFYDGDGPRRDYTVTIPGGTGYATPDQRNAEKLLNITWGEDVQPAVNGRYFVVARHSTKVMEVAGASTADGANIQQNAYSGGTYQQWDFVPLPSTNGGDYSYFTVKAAHSGKSADINNWGHDDGVNVMQWSSTGGANQHWFLEYAGNGYFYIRSRWSGKFLDVAGISTANGANIYQWSGTGGSNQQWRLIPVGASPIDLTPPAVPAGVIAAANALSVQLSWNAVVAADLAGYTVLRATNSGGPYEIIARGLTNNAFTDKSANQPRTYFYVVKSSDRSLNPSANSTQVSATPTAGPTLALRYAFEGNANDSSGNANHPIILNGAPTYAAGKYGSAMDLNGSSQYAMLPAGMFASVTNFTIALWVNWDGGGAWQRIFDFGNNTTQYMFLTPSSGSGTLRFAITTNGTEQILQTSPPPIGQWQHIAISRNGNTAKLYTNGVLAVSGSVTIPLASFNPALNYLGDSQFPADPLFNGRLDELFIYNYALSDQEITRLAVNQPPPPTVPTRLTSSLTGNTLFMSWPTNYLGCRLESNSISLITPGSWFTVFGSAATNQMSLPINPTDSNVFFRLVYP